jgi:hypothetical protein
MDRLNLLIIADTHKINRDVFADFIQQRFPNERDKSYIHEWATRFSTGTPQIYMDGVSKRILQTILDKY